MKNIDRFIDCRAIRLMVYIMMGLLFLVLYVQTMGKAYRPYGYDLDAYLLGAKTLMEGGNPFVSPEGTPFIYIYPLFLAFIFIPLTFVPEFILHTAWYFANVACLLLSGYMMIKAIRVSSIFEDSPARICSLLFLGALVSFGAIQNSLLNGQVNLIVMFCCVMFFYCYQQEGEKSYSRGWKSCAWLAVAIAIKLTPAVLLGFFLVRREFKLLICTVLFSLVLMLLPFVLVGSQVFYFYETYLSSFVLYKFTATSEILVNVDAFAPGFNVQSVIGLSYPEVFNYSWVKWLGAALVICLLFYTDITISKNSREFQWIGFSAYLVGSLLLSPVGEKHHVTIIEPVLVVMLYGYLYNRKAMAYIPLFIGVVFLVLRFMAGEVLDNKIYMFFPLMWLLFSMAYLARKMNAMGLVVNNGDVDARP